MYNTLTSQPEQVVLIEGINFQGEAKLVGTTLHIQIVQFGKGEFYTAQITNTAITENLEGYMGFESAREIYKEIIVNREMQFSNTNNSLLVYFKLVYQDKPLKMKLQLPLAPKIVQSNSKIQSLLKLVESLSLQKIKSKKYLPQIIEFKGDQSNINYKQFQIRKDPKQVKMLRDKEYLILNHFDVLPTTGIHYFKVKIIKSFKKQIFLGVCAKNIIQSVNIKNNQDMLGLHLKGQYRIKVANLIVEEGVSVFKVQINMDNKWISWYLNDTLLCTSDIGSLANKSIYPMVSLFNLGDTIEFLDK